MCLRKNDVKGGYKVRKFECIIIIVTGESVCLLFNSDSYKDKEKTETKLVHRHCVVCQK